MNRLIMHHFYERTAFDLSDNRNHGAPIAVTRAAPPNSPGFDFEQSDSEVRVSPSGTLSDLWSVRVIITFNLTLAGPITRRYNLMEGHLSFAFFVENDGSLMGTIVDNNGNWTGAKSAPGLITTNQWHTAEMQHDGINSVRLLFDGVEVAASYNAPGQVRTVGPHGIAIGHWPEPPGVYTFTGFIREARLYKYDPHKDANGLLDHCCVDKKALDEAATTLRGQGATPESLEAKGREILQFGYSLLAQVRGSDPAVSQQQQQLSAAAVTSYISGNQSGYTTALAQLALLAQARLNKPQMEDIRKREEDIMGSLPLPFAEFRKLLKSVCWDRVGIDPQGLVDAMQRLQSIRPNSPRRGEGE